MRRSRWTRWHEYLLCTRKSTEQINGTSDAGDWIAEYLTLRIGHRCFLATYFGQGRRYWHVFDAGVGFVCLTRTTTAIGQRKGLKNNVESIYGGRFFD